MRILKASCIVMVLGGVALFMGCNSTASTPLAPDVEGAPAATAMASSQDPVLTTSNRGNGALGVVYVSSQGLYYDTFVAAEELPAHGPFQLLEDGVTEFGPGDRGYRGGRWMVPNGNGGFDYFLCPLLPPGREEK